MIDSRPEGRMYIKKPIILISERVLVNMTLKRNEFGSQYSFIILIISLFILSSNDEIYTF